MLSLILTLGACGGSDTGLGAGKTDATVPDGVATVDIAPWSVVWTDLTLGYSFSREFTLTSTADGTLLVDEIRLVSNPDGVFVFDPEEDVEIAAGESIVYTVAADLDLDHPLDTYASGQIRIESNDAECDTALLPLSAYPEGYTGTLDTATTESPCQ